MSFWLWPLWTPVNFENDVSQARDLLAAERNFLTGIRTAFTVAVASVAIVFQNDVLNRGNWADWVLAGMLLAIALNMPILSLLNYAIQFDAHHREEPRIHNSKWVLATLMVTGVIAVLVAVREGVRDS